MAPEIPEGYLFSKKVIAYVTLEHKLLVFRQPAFKSAGIQVPAGTIEPDETPLDDVIREMKEETGLTNFIVNGKLGVYYYDMSFYRKEIQERHVYHIMLDQPAPDEWHHYETNAELSKDEAIEFDFFWLDMKNTIDLAGGQGELLSKIIL